MLRVLPALLALAMLVLPAPSSAQENHEALTNRVNSGTVGIVSGGITGTYIKIAADLASVLDNGEDLRILPVIGKGSVQNITDILYLRGIDIGIVQSDTLAYLKKEGTYPGIESRINYISKLYNEEFHLVAAKGIQSIEELAGKKVNLGVPGSGTYMTASTVFGILGVEVEPMQIDQALAIEKIKSGEIAATIYIAGKPTRVVADLTEADGIHLVPIPFSDALQEIYLPASLTAADYPNLVAPGDRVDTLAVGAVLAVFNWKANTERYNKVVRFIDAFFSRFAEFQQAPRHPKWREVNLAAQVPGWARFPPAEQWLEQAEEKARVAMRDDFQRFLTENGSRKLRPNEQEALFKRFMEWRQSATQ